MCFENNLVFFISKVPKLIAQLGAKLGTKPFQPSHGYLLCGTPDEALSKCAHYFIEILEKLMESLCTRLESITESTLFNAMACFLDTKSYALSEASEDILNYANIVADTFLPMLIANNCNLNKLHSFD